MGSLQPVIETAYHVIAQVFRDFVKFFSTTPTPQPDDIQKKHQKDPYTLREEARKELGLDCVNHYNFGIAGNSGTGKSSLVNAITRAKPGDANYAEEGEVETTHHAKRYDVTTCTVLWDLPGVGTAKHPPETYVTSKRLYALMFTDGELRVAAELKKWKTPIVFVRTKTDIALVSKLRRGGTAKSGDKIGNAIHELRFETSLAIRPQLIQYDYGSSQIFFVSSWVLRAIHDPRDPSRSWDEDDEETLDELREIKRLRQLEMDEISFFMYIAKTASIRCGGGTEK
ncbi:hypothetical protein SeLEV6574_g00640 [Synchytrium endobioticum]|uniref:IRG-type G domain-containing protein n=1 Tax=Synchytrium endobioticum TaxID=286115 RepID=A0A507DHX8_9FUNG|nr:hypothetical protein SeLEV6574_g00640 [Synchytrium endobioticum]